MENFVEFEYYFQSNQLHVFRDVIKERFNTYIIIEKPNLVIFNRIDKKYRLNGQLHSNEILQDILNDSEYKQDKKPEIFEFV